MSPGPRRDRGRGASRVTFDRLMDRPSWAPLPAIALLAGSARFFKERIIARFARELFGEERPEIQRYRSPSRDKSADELPLSRVLDELRTPSFLSPHRLVVIDDADAFLSAHRASLEPFVEPGFGGGHLILCLRRPADGRTKLTKKITAAGWAVECRQPFDRPPPWDSRTPVWESDLSRWIVSQAGTKELRIDTRTAFVLHDRVGTDLEILDEELEKLSTYLNQRGTREVTEEAVLAVTGDLREDSIFAVVDLLLEGRRPDAIRAVERLLDHGFHGESGQLVLDPTGIALPLAGAMVHRLRAIRRAHAISASGGSSDDWISQRIVQKPFLDRFQRQLRATPPGRIRELFDRLYTLDRSIKRGGDARHLLLTVMAS